MKVVYMEVPGAASDEMPTLIIQVDEKVTITVKNYGTALYRWKAQWPVDFLPEDQIKGIPGELDAEGFCDGEFLGQALVWAHPITFAHVVMDLIQNQ
jgi:hypothetical protein